MPRSRVHNLLRSLLLLAILARGVIPAGFMPGHAGDGKFPLVICSGLSGTKTVYLPAGKLPGGAPEGPQHKDGASHAPCVFSAAFAFGWIETAPQAAEAALQTRIDILPPPIAAQAGVSAKPWQSRAPPSVLLAA